MTTELLTTRQVAEYLGVHVNTVLRLCHHAGLPFYRVGTRDLRFRREEVDRWLEERRR